MIDITVRLHEATPGYPGDPGFSRRLAADFTAGAGCRLSALALSAHAGTHVDAPAHFLEDGATLDELPVDFFCGPARVVACSAFRLDRACIAGAGPQAGEFLLLKTTNSALWRETGFRPDYAALDETGAEVLVAAGAKGVGIDYLSVERPGGEGAVHRMLLRAGLAIVEGLDLSAVEPGEYSLICLPLRLAGAEGAPARAVLMPKCL